MPSFTDQNIKMTVTFGQVATLPAEMRSQVRVSMDAESGGYLYAFYVAYLQQNQSYTIVSVKGFYDTDPQDPFFDENNCLIKNEKTGGEEFSFRETRRFLDRQPEKEAAEKGGNYLLPAIPMEFECANYGLVARDSVMSLKH